jgi:ATP-binding cassette, subfamily B, bacterial
VNTEFSEILIGFKRTLGLLRSSEKISLLVATFLMLIAGVLTNLPAVILGKLVDRIGAVDASFNFSIVLPFIGTVVIIILIREVLTVIRKYLVENIATQTEKEQTIKAIDVLLKSDISIINQQQIGSIHGKIFRSIRGLIQMIKLGFLDFFPVFFSAIAAVAIALYQKPLLASVMILVIPTGLFIIIKQISSQKGIRVSLIRGKEKIDGVVVEMLGGIETVRVANTSFMEVKKIEEVAESLRVKEIKHHISMALFDSAKYLNEGFFYILVISLSIYFASIGVITKGDILVYSILFASITGPLREIHRILDQAHESSILVNDLNNLLTTPLDESFVNVQSQLSNLEPKDQILEVSNLSFSFPGKEQILNGINLKIKKGEKIGIVGASGCGKSTFIKILLRLFHNYSGEVYLFGQDLKTISREQIAEKIAYIPQKTYIFSGNIRDNITYGISRKVSEAEIIEAAKQANIYVEIEKSLGGLNGRVEENGNNLSGGQKQRLALARLILKSPEIFIFDEATSALDNTNEKIVQENIEKLFKDEQSSSSSKTTLTIAHRLTTLKNCDRILVFDKGQIIQQGTFSELSQKRGLFQEFLKER